MPVTIGGSGPITGVTSINTSVSDTELGYLDGLTEPLTTSLAAKAPLESPTFTGSVGLPATNVTGILQVTGSGVYQFNTRSDDGDVHFAKNSNGSFAAVCYYAQASRAANSAYKLFYGISSAGGSADVEFNLRGDGNAYADGTWTGGGADYAEYFEWADGNPANEDRRGIAVTLDGDKITPAADGDPVIGVISGNPSVVGDGAWNKWSGKYLRDEYGSYILDANGDRTPNPDFDPEQEYVPREERPEWGCVGLVGKLRVRKGQPVDSRWIKMRDVSDTVAEYLVR